MKIKFIGAARTVTGSKHLVTTEKGIQILLDCGVFQGKGLDTDKMNRDLKFEPKEIDHILLSHAHIDHIGLIPYLYKKGFRGSIICTHATRDLCSIMLADSAHIQELDAKWYNKKAKRKHLPSINPIYNVVDAEECMKLFIGTEYDKYIEVDENIRVQFTHSGHMLGSAVVNLEIIEQGKKKRIAYTGDIGRPTNKLLRSPEPFPQCDYLIAESTYGNRTHQSEKETEDELLKIVLDTCVRKRGKLIIPSFSIGRTQEIVYVLNNLYNENKIPHLIDVYVDSPLSVNATDIFRKYTDIMNDDIKETMITDSDPFGFNSLHYIKDVNESKALNSDSKPCIIISSSGMMEAGRVKHHVSNNISNAQNTILIVGYCAPTTLGARIQQKGLREISIFGIPHKVNIEIKKIESFSGHGDYQEMIQFLNCQEKTKIKNVFLVHGEYETQQEYAQTLKTIGYNSIDIPKSGEEFSL